MTNEMMLLLLILWLLLGVAICIFAKVNDL
jgi:hypothetical protein